MLLSSLCPPALLYVGFSVVQIIIDTLKGGYNTALFKFIIMIVFTILLNTLCRQGLGIISWFIVFIPFLLMTFLTTLLLFVFDLSPESGKRSDREIINSKPVERKEKESEDDPRTPSHNSDKSA
jgi:hypothetical protein